MSQTYPADQRLTDLASSLLMWIASADNPEIAALEALANLSPLDERAITHHCLPRWRDYMKRDTVYEIVVASPEEKYLLEAIGRRNNFNIKISLSGPQSTSITDSHTHAGNLIAELLVLIRRAQNTGAAIELANGEFARLSPNDKRAITNYYFPGWEDTEKGRKNRITNVSDYAEMHLAEASRPQHIWTRYFLSSVMLESPPKGPLDL